MARKKASMVKIREIIKLSEKNLSHRQISRVVGLSRPVVAKYIERFKASRLSVTGFCALDDTALSELLSGPVSDPGQKQAKLRERFTGFATELKRTGVNLQILWHEYREEEPTGYSYSQFCHYFSLYRDNDKLSMHMEHKAGDKAFVDFTGKKIEYTERSTGEIKEVEIFVGVLGASLYTYVEALASQKLPDWIRANENMLHFFGGVPSAIVPDNLKSAVTKTNRYEPDINVQFGRFAEHYGTVILPARPVKPKDKALVENTVNIIYSRIFAPLRNATFFSIAEINDAIRPLLESHNNRIMRLYDASRQDLFTRLDKPALGSLPQQKYEFRECEIRKVQINYHVYLSADGHYYSVPFQHRGKEVELWYGSNTVEIILKNQRIAKHLRVKNGKGKYSTQTDHMPAKHAWIHQWSPERFLSWAAKLGDNVKTVIGTILDNAKHPEQAYKVCMGIISLNNKYGNARLDNACSRAISFKAYSYKSIKSILENGLDREIQGDLFPEILPFHENIRGESYYNGG